MVQLRLPVCAAGYPGVVNSNSEYCDNLIGFDEQSEIKIRGVERKVNGPD